MGGLVVLRDVVAPLRRRRRVVGGRDGEHDVVAPLSTVALVTTPRHH